MATSFGEDVDSMMKEEGRCRGTNLTAAKATDPRVHAGCAPSPWRPTQGGVLGVFLPSLHVVGRCSCQAEPPGRCTPRCCYLGSAGGPPSARGSLVGVSL